MATAHRGSLPFLCAVASEMPRCGHGIFPGPQRERKLLPIAPGRIPQRKLSGRLNEVPLDGHPEIFLRPGGPHPTDGLSTVPGPNAGSPPLRFFLFLLLFKVVQRSRCFFLSTRVCQVVALSSLVVNVAVEVGQLLCPVFSLRSLCVWRAISV